MIKIIERLVKIIMAFTNDLIFGKEAEQMVIDWFKDHQDKYELIDVSEDADYQKKDIDFLIRRNKDDNLFSIEVKNSTNTLDKSRSIRVEDKEQYKSTYQIKDGWLWFSEADYFCFTDTKKKEFHMIRAKYLRKYIYDNSLHEEMPSLYIYESNYKKTWNYWLNLDDLKKAKIVKTMKCN